MVGILKTIKLFGNHFNSYFHNLFIALDFTINIHNVNSYRLTLSQMSWMKG